MRQHPASTGGRPLHIGKYEIVALIASGGMGAVFKGIDTRTHKPVAIKILSAELAARPAMVERFRREGRSALRLRHPNIVAGYECGEWNGTLFLALEYVKGEDLEDHIVRLGRLQPEFARHVILQAARALEHAHNHEIVHRDIKPSNFLLKADRNKRLLVKLVDLGLARAANEDESRITNPDVTVGTVDYMAPEQARNSAAADIRSDIYALGCTYFHMLAGQCPFSGGTVVERILKHREAEPPDVRTFNPAVPAATARIIAKTLAKDPAQRYQTPADLLADLENPAWFPGSIEPPEFRPVLSRAAARAHRLRRQRLDRPPDDSATEEFGRGKTKEVTRQEKVVGVPGKRFRDDPDPSPTLNAEALWRRAWPWALVGGSMVALATLLWFVVHTIS